MRSRTPLPRASAALPARTIAHDIRNSLATIRMAVQSVATEQLSDRARLRLRIAEREIESIDALLDTLSNTLKAPEK